MIATCILDSRTQILACISSNDVVDRVAPGRSPVFASEIVALTRNPAQISSVRLRIATSHCKGRAHRHIFLSALIVIFHRWIVPPNSAEPQDKRPWLLYVVRVSYRTSVARRCATKKLPRPMADFALFTRDNVRVCIACAIITTKYCPLFI
jgi:hypothetical protein